MTIKIAMSAVYTSNIVVSSLSTSKSYAAGQLEGLDVASRSSSSSVSDTSSDMTLRSNTNSASSSFASSSPSSSRASLTELPSTQDNNTSSHFFAALAHRRVIVQVFDDLEDSPYASSLEEDFYNSSYDCSLDSSFDSSDFEVDSLTGDFITGAQARRVLSVPTFRNVSTISNRALFTITECSPAPGSTSLVRTCRSRFM
ncbi:hypothetical protein BDZ89DRAFT_1059969 [Hymenopellis radicata]|nr:hypothetical protein BDZ89DRAFT_1059969 [Hymenopellis radicata]